MLNYQREKRRQGGARATGVGLLLALVGALAFFGLYWLALLLINHHPAFIPNAERRAAMFRFLNQQRRARGNWRPQQGDHWIF
jgi:hypothetical protein